MSVQITRLLMDELKNRSETELSNAIAYIIDTLSSRKLTTSGPGAPIDIELLLRSATYLAEKDKHPLSGFVSAWHAGLKTIDPSGDGLLFRRLILTTKKILPDLLQHKKSVRYLAGINRLVSVLQNKNRCAPIVFTLNYDICIEQALRDANLEFTTGFKNGIWHPAEFGNQQRIRLFKLHGSLGWVRHPERRILFDANESFQRDDILQEGPDINHEIIFAVDNKLQAAQPFLWLFQKCAELVAQAAYVVCIGYSFRDEHVNEIIGQALAADSNKCMVFVGPDVSENTLTETRKITFYPNRVTPIKMKAKRALTGNAILEALDTFESAKRGDIPF